ncbi:MAG TPA: hypothetical protein VFZ53_10350 [Polyangiaceae bacterium]
MSDHLLRQLLEEVRTEHRDRKAQFDTIERRLTVLESRVQDNTVATSVLAKEIHDLRKLAFEGDDSLRKRIRLVSDFAGMTDPQEGNGNGNG